MPNDLDIVTLGLTLWSILILSILFWMIYKAIFPYK